MKRKRAAVPVARRKQEASKWPEKTAKRAVPLEPGLFERSAKEIATAVKRAAEESPDIKGTPRQSAMGVLGFLLNRSGKSMAPERRRRLERAKNELRKLFEREARE